MGNFDERFVLAFYNSFLRIELKCDKENMFFLNTYSFQKRMLFNLTCVLIYLRCAFEYGFKDSCAGKFCITCRDISMIEFTVKEVTVFRVTTFLNEALHQI